MVYSRWAWPSIHCTIGITGGGWAESELNCSRELWIGEFSVSIVDASAQDVLFVTEPVH